jgi:ADP-heptose:LPS heptosyltransferase
MPQLMGDMPQKAKFLILRFSSFGDVTQCLSVPSKLIDKYPDSTIHWAVRDDLALLLENHPCIHKIWRLNRSSGLKSLFKLAQELKKEDFTHIYDAHNSTRSLFISFYLSWNRKVQILRKSQKRIKRVLLFYFKYNTYRQPFSGQRDLLEPLAKWGITETLPLPPQLFIKKEEMDLIKNKLPSQPFVVLAPSAAYELKRWPVDYWIKLIELESHRQFVLLGGPSDLFLNKIKDSAPSRVTNLAGHTDLRQSSAVVAHSQLLISNDTGILHTAEQLGHPTIALMGPAPFGFPSRPSTQIMQLNLSCRPCSKHGQGPCVNKNYQACLRDITPTQVQLQMKALIK